ncbi:MAG: response regulator [Nitrososphaera sp.]|nr:response regulator [Nitrososphaera sp.]
MIIEDEDDLLLVYKDFLESRGYRIEVSAPTANEVMWDYDTYRPDLVIIDFRLRGSLNGLQAAEKILRYDSSARILILTAFENVRDRIEKDEFFGDKHISYLRKPVPLSQLVMMISTL